ncbi:MAG: cupin domain-containing protein [Myxococcota bacterium]
MQREIPGGYRFDTGHVRWTRLEGGDEFDYPIDYEMAVLGAQPDIGTLDLLVKWAPNAYCHFHRHCAATTVLVLEGEQHVVEVTEGGETIHKVRKAGTYAHSPGGDVHMEHGGPEGALVFFAMHAPDGRVFDLLDRDGNVLVGTTVAEMAKDMAAFPR